MNQTMKKLLAVLLSLALLLSLLPTAALASAPQRKMETEEESHRAQEPAGESRRNPDEAVEEKHMYGDLTVQREDDGEQPPPPSAADPARRDTSVPSSYNSNALGYVTPVKNQAYGDCWAHAAMACCETYMIKHAVPAAANGVIGAPATTSLDLSENHFAYFGYTDPWDALDMLHTNNQVTFGNNLFAYGANGDISMYTLMRWEGPANEATSALAYRRDLDGSEDHKSQPTTSSYDAVYAYAYDAGHVTNAIHISNANDTRSDVKRAIMEYGAGFMTYYSSDPANDLNYSTGAYYHKNACSVDHAVTVVGWDDNYAVSNFKSEPPGPGAWIIKNSWGTTYPSGNPRPNDGYYYISYYDYGAYYSDTYFFAVEPLDAYDNNYQYDGTTNFYNYTNVSAGGSVAHSYTANGAETLRAVALGTADQNVGYTLKIYTGGDPSASDPTTGATLAAQQSGTLTYAGYQKIELNQPVALTSGQRFVVLFELTSSTTKKLSVDMTTYYNAWKLQWTHTVPANTAYVNASGSGWVNTSSFNLRIKAYTTNQQFNLSAVSNDGTLGTVQVSGSNVIAQPAAGCGVDSVELLSGTATWNRNGNIVSVFASGDCTIRINFVRLSQYTLTFVCNNVVTTDTAYANTPYALPTEQDIGDWGFYGWAKQRVDHVIADDDPCDVFDDYYTAEGDETFYALFLDMSGDDFVWTTEFTPPCDHIWGDWTVTQEPTASADGSRTRTCTRCDASESETISKNPAVNGYNLTTNGDVLVNSYISVPKYLTDAGMYVTIDGGDPILLSSITTTPDANGYVKTDDGFKFPYTVPAKNMQDTVTLRLYQSNGTQVVPDGATNAAGDVTYSVQGYINQVLDDAATYEAAYPGITDLCKAMRAYGSYAQVQQNYTTPAPVSVDSDTASAISAINTSSISAASTASTTTNSIDGLEFYGASLVMLSKMTLRFYFTYSGSATLTSGGNALATKGDYYYVDVTGIAAKDFGEGQSVEVFDGTNTCTVSGYSVNRYVYKVLTASGVDASMLNLAKAIAYYGIKAAAYYRANN